MPHNADRPALFSGSQQMTRRLVLTHRGSADVLLGTETSLTSNIASLELSFSSLFNTIVELVPGEANFSGCQKHHSIPYLFPR